MELSAIASGLASFEAICALMDENEVLDIVDAVAQGLGKSYVRNLPAAGRAKNKTSRYYYHVLRDMKENLPHYRWLYGRLKDARSREVFVSLLRYRILPYAQYLKSAFDGDHEQYFAPGIVACAEDEVFVDCGGFIGDTVQSFVRHCPKYRHIYTYEPSAENLARCREAAAAFERVTVRPCGVGKKEETVTFSQTGSSSSFILDNTHPQNVSEVKITSLDADIAEPVSFIKMDVEGFEVDALIGAKRHIRDESPKLAICVYHLPSDIWEIPRLIDAINPDYDFYMRHYNAEQSWETVIYAIPKAPETRPALPEKEHPGVYAVNGYFGFWTNLELTKDCGAVPFLLYKRFGCRAVMLTAPGREYPSLETYTRGMEVDFTADASLQARCRYVEEHASDMDVLLLYGPHPHYFNIVDTYRKYRPDGRVYLSLDPNSLWMDKIRWDEPRFSRFMGQCDVIGSSCRRMQRLLGIKWPWKIEYIPNGFYNFAGCDMGVDIAAKENVILTAGRLGTNQKQTEVLLDAFARAADKIPGWTLRLAGPLKEGFQSRIDAYFEEHPQLRERVTFLGMIDDRERLLAEYKRAKIFALPSECEGGNPNVAAEALFCGCCILAADFDASQDITDGGRCGRVFPIGDSARMAQLFAEVCNDAPLLEEGARAAVECARLVYDYEKIIGRIHYLLFTEGL